MFAGGKLSPGRNAFSERNVSCGRNMFPREKSSGFCLTSRLASRIEDGSIADSLGKVYGTGIKGAAGKPVWATSFGLLS